MSELFAERIAQAEAISPSYAQLWRSIATLSQAGGKRLRPHMVLLAYTIGNHGDTATNTILPAAAAQELLHLAMLIHDDIIDRDDTRYGIKNISGQYDDLYQPHISNTHQRLHFSNSAALMAGDLLIAEAYRLIQQCAVSADHIADAQAVLSEAVFRVIGGELLDTEATFRPRGTISALTIAQQKTASYSFVSPLTMGAQLADLPTDTVERLRNFGIALGTAYQLQDDLLGTFGDETITGKSSQSDLIEGKYTYLVEQFYLLADQPQQKQFNVIFKNTQASEADIDQARQLLIASGAVQAVNVAIDNLTEQAQVQLDQVAMSHACRAAFTELVQACVKRTA